MPVLNVVSAGAVSGRTAIAVGLGQGFAAAGRAVQLFRLGTSAASVQDARTLAGFAFASSPGTPVAIEAVRPAGNSIAIVESDAGPAPGSGQTVLVVRAAPTEADIALGRSLGDRLVGTIATLVAPAEIENVARAMTNAGLRPLALLPEDRVLAAPGVDEIRAALGAEVLYEGENAFESVDDVIVAPVYTDPARPHMKRFERRAVLTPSYKTDLQLAAIEANSLCLVVTGGRRPSHYVLDRVQGEATTILLAPQETFAAVNALEGVWTNSRFRGEHKAEAVFALMASRLDFGAVAKKLG